jgi:hypothetical protein
MKNTMNEIHNRISRAQEYARNAHAHIIATTVSGVIRPHIVHIQEVADLVWASGGSDDEVVAGVEVKQELGKMRKLSRNQIGQK